MRIMSFPFYDYLPCDLTHYQQHILPVWCAAQQGDFQPLQALILAARHFSCWPLFNLPDPLPDPCFAGPKCYFGWDSFEKGESVWPQLFGPRTLPLALREELLRDAEETQECSFWTLCSRHLPAFFAGNEATEAQTFLFRSLFYTFCCQLPSEAMADCRAIGNEDVGLWVEYMERNSQVQALWGRFRQPAPQPLANQLLSPQTYQQYLAALQHGPGRCLRALIEADDSIIGFLDREETVHVLTHLPTQERPELYEIISGCIRDREKAQWLLPPELEALWRRIHYTWPEYESNMYELSVSPYRDAFRASMKRYREKQRHHYKAFLQSRIQDEQQIRAIYRACCAYWNEAYPQSFQEHVNRYYQSLERMETEILNRFRYAVERGWGMIEIWRDKL